MPNNEGSATKLFEVPNNALSATTQVPNNATLSNIVSYQPFSHPPNGEVHLHVESHQPKQGEDHREEQLTVLLVDLGKC